MQGYCGGLFIPCDLGQAGESCRRRPALAAPGFPECWAAGLAALYKWGRLSLSDPPESEFPAQIGPHGPDRPVWAKLVQMSPPGPRDACCKRKRSRDWGNPPYPPMLNQGGFYRKNHASLNDTVSCYLGGRVIGEVRAAVRDDNLAVDELEVDSHPARGVGRVADLQMTLEKDFFAVH